MFIFGAATGTIEDIINYFKCEIPYAAIGKYEKMKNFRIIINGSCRSDHTDLPIYETSFNNENEDNHLYDNNYLPGFYYNDVNKKIIYRVFKCVEASGETNTINVYITPIVNIKSSLINLEFNKPYTFRQIGNRLEHFRDHGYNVEVCIFYLGYQKVDIVKSTSTWLGTNDEMLAVTNRVYDIKYLRKATSLSKYFGKVFIDKIDCNFGYSTVRVSLHIHAEHERTINFNDFDIIDNEYAKYFDIKEVK